MNKRLKRKLGIAALVLLVGAGSIPSKAGDLNSFLKKIHIKKESQRQRSIKAMDYGFGQLWRYVLQDDSEMAGCHIHVDKHRPLAEERIYNDLRKHVGADSLKMRNLILDPNSGIDPNSDECEYARIIELTSWRNGKELTNHLFQSDFGGISDISEDEIDPQFMESLRGTAYDSLDKAVERYEKIHGRSPDFNKNRQLLNQLYWEELINETGLRKPQDIYGGVYIHLLNDYKQRNKQSLNQAN